MCFKQLVGVSCLRMLKTLGIQPSTGLLGDKHCSHYIIQPTMNHLSPCSLAWYLIVWSIWLIWSTFVEFVILGVTSLSWPAAIYSILNFSILPNHRGFVLLGETVVCNVYQTFFFPRHFFYPKRHFKATQRKTRRSELPISPRYLIMLKSNQTNTIFISIFDFLNCVLACNYFDVSLGLPGLIGLRKYKPQEKKEWCVDSETTFPIRQGGGK